MKAYWVSLYTEISDQDNLKKYGENAIPVIKKFGGTPVVRGGKLKYYSGDKILRTVIWEFPSYNKAISCHDLFPKRPCRPASNRFTRCSRTC